MTPTQRSKRLLEDDGWIVAIVERWNPHARIRQDLFGFADLLACKPKFTPKLIQVTSTGWASRIAKVRAEPLAKWALQSGFDIEVHGWRKLKSNKGKWTPIVTPIIEEDFQ